MVTRRKPDPHHVPAEYGKELSRLAKANGFPTDRSISKAAGYKGGPTDQTMRRLRIGEGSLESAINVRNVLLHRGVDVPPVPVGQTFETTPRPTEHSALVFKIAEWAPMDDMDREQINSLAATMNAKYAQFNPERLSQRVPGPHVVRAQLALSTVETLARDQTAGVLSPNVQVKGGRDSRRTRRPARRRQTTS